ncbi:MAG TPA: hypothetical protein DIC35_00145 [Candidatus Moranbacteria bacterium]|nr:hypothetical protein [Candidatus Moranbacteria bacterium]
MNYQHLFSNDAEFLSFVRENIKFFTGCSDCHRTWVENNRINNCSASLLGKLAFTAMLLNVAMIEQGELLDLGVQLYFDRICPECFARSEITPIIRQQQIKQGYSPCFCTGILDCDQFKCSHRSTCIRPENILPVSEKAVVAYSFYLQQSIQQAVFMH